MSVACARSTKAGWYGPLTGPSTSARRRREGRRDRRRGCAGNRREGEGELYEAVFGAAAEGQGHGGCGGGVRGAVTAARKHRLITRVFSCKVSERRRSQ